VSKPVRRTPEEALRTCVDAIGGLQEVGHTLRPDLSPEIAGQWLAHCLTAKCRDKLSLSQIWWIQQRAKAAGEHSGNEQWNQGIGYQVTAVIDPKEEMADMAKQAEQHARQASELSREVIERMRAANINFDL